ncbi:hypothetical protein [Stenotrophomonas maltophilia]|uniref:hypothetical protein n=1 Tax=Stenotrophomonas maltophilia TaxID=40324 RepID=UPI000B4E21AD|nr:hypothetical protein [Stenotrophomonas maltophilia]OWQ56614.1 hypothetical protein CEE59_11885 [Stenotrophomonas maltophilia]
MSTDKTLADVQPGGTVRLGDADPMRSALEDALQFVETLHSTVSGDSRKIVWRCLERGRAALSAQPSPGGQEYAWNIAELVRVDLDRQSCPDAYMRIAMESVVKHLAARQPVGELVFRERPTHNAYRGSFSGPCRCWADADHAVGNEVMRYAAPPAQVVDLAPDHRGMRVSYSGLLNQVRGGLNSNPELAEMVRQLHGHLNELGKRWYAGDRKVVDEFLQLYVIEDGARRALIDSQAVGK